MQRKGLGMDANIFERALAEATARLQEVDLRFEELGKEKERLQDLVGSLQAVLAATPTQAPTPISADFSPVRAVEQNPVFQASPPVVHGATWKLAFHVLSKEGPMTVPQIYQAFFKWTKAPPSKDALRIAMLRKSNLFRNEGGTFSVIEGNHQNGRPEPQTAELEWKEATEVPLPS
jgi:hypothetical protein